MGLPFLAFVAVSAFTPATPAFDPRQHKNEIAGQPAQVLVLGTMHLSQLPKPPDPAMLEPLLDRLARFKPDVITIEGLSGEECDALHRFDTQHGGSWKDYCWDTADVEKASGLTVPAATSESPRCAKTETMPDSAAT